MRRLLVITLIVGGIMMSGCEHSDRQSGTLPEAHTRTGVEKNTFFPVSVWYSGGKARAPMLSVITEESADAWRRDLRQIKDLGFNTVRTWVEWSKVNPHPGVYRFDNLKLLAELAQETDLKFIIQLYVDSAPDWVGKEFPDGYFETQSGAKVKSQVAPGYCTDHFGVRTAVLHFITETARVATQYSNFHGWDLWSEPHIVNWAYINYVPNVQFCYCEHTVARFRTWLMSKYGSLEKLNEAWYRQFSRWEEVEPPRFGTILSYTDFIDWKNFIYDKLAEDLGMRHAAVRKADPSHVVTSHAAVPSIFYTPYNGYGATDDFLMADNVDFYGTSLYPKHNHPSRHWEIWKFMVAVDFSRSANRRNGGFYVGELQAGRGTIGLNIGDPITPGDHRIWMWSAVAKGAKAINIYAYFPMSSGYESGGYGLINLDGTLTERAVEAGRTARIIDQNQALILSSKPVDAQIALVYNPLSQMVGGEQHHGSGDMHQLSLFGYYRYFSEHHIPVDFIHRRDLENRKFGDYKLIILSYPLMLSREAADGLTQFVNDGGYLFSEARPAWNDERGYAALTIPGMGLDSVFGVQESGITMRDEVSFTLSGTVHPLTSGLRKGDILKGAYFAESFALTEGSGAEVLALNRDGTPGMTVNRFGKGEAFLAGTFIGLANHQNPDPNTGRLLGNMLDWAGVQPPLRCFLNGPDKSEVEVRLMENDRGWIVFIINYGEKAGAARVEIEVKKDGLFMLRDLLGSETRQLSSKDRHLGVESRLAARDVVVLVVEGP